MGAARREICVLLSLFLTASFCPVILALVTEEPKQGNTRGKGDNSVDRTDGQCGCRATELSLNALGMAISAVSNAVETASSAARAAENKVVAMEARLASIEEKSEQYETHLQTLESLVAANLSSFEDRLQASSLQVGFTVRFFADPVTNIGTNAIYPFNDLLTNVGNAYSVQTGAFTAPTSGLYAFSLNVMSTNDNSALHLSIDVNGVPVGNVWAEGSTDINDQSSTTVVTSMLQGQQALVRHRGGTSVIRGSLWAVFSGFLVQPQ